MYQKNLLQKPKKLIKRPSTHDAKSPKIQKKS